MLRRLASCLLVVGLAVVGAGCGASRKAVAINGLGPVPGSRIAETVPQEARVGPGPFVLDGGWAGGGGSGLLGDGASGPGGTSLGCVDDRRYTFAFGIENRTKAPVTLTAATGSNQARRIVDRVATQLRLSPPERPRSNTVDNRGGPAGMDLVYRRWSAAPTRPVRIPPHRIATVQIDFLMRHCGALARGRTVTVPGSLVLGYRTSGHSGRQKLALPGNRLVVTAGPKKRTCVPVSGSESLVTADLGCEAARRLAPACRAMKNGGWLGCTVDGRVWDCGRFAGPGYPLLETCYLPRQKSHWFSVVWIGRGLGLWGTVQNRRWRLGLRRGEARPATRGVCEVHTRPRTLVFESSALRVLRGKAIARVASDARVKLVLLGYRGAGTYPASISAPPGIQLESAVQVAIGLHGATHGLYVATAGRITIVRARQGSISGTVYASLRDKTAPKTASLNGTWTCRVGKGR